MAQKHKPTNEEIIAAVEAGFGGGYIPSNRMIEVTRTKGQVEIHACAMYEYLPLTFATMKAISDLFGTTELEGPERQGSSGCETCDYGSKYEWWIRVKIK